MEKSIAAPFHPAKFQILKFLSNFSQIFPHVAAIESYYFIDNYSINSLTECLKSCASRAISERLQKKLGQIIRCQILGKNLIRRGLRIDKETFQTSGAGLKFKSRGAIKKRRGSYYS